jgi:hypothetical protein
MTLRDQYPDPNYRAPRGEPATTPAPQPPLLTGDLIEVERQLLNMFTYAMRSERQASAFVERFSGLLLQLRNQRANPWTTAWPSETGFYWLHNDRKNH